MSRPFSSFAIQQTNFRWDATDPSCSTSGQFDPAKLCSGNSSCYLKITAHLVDAGGAVWHVKGDGPTTNSTPYAASEGIAEDLPGFQPTVPVPGTDPPYNYPHIILGQ